MRTSRRHLIKLGLCATASLVTFCEVLSGRVALAAVSKRAVPKRAAPKGAAPSESSLWLTREMFEARVGESLAVQKPKAGAIPLRLLRVEDVLSARNAGTVAHPDCFTVLLRGSRSSRLVQGTYRVESPSLGQFLLFLVPLRTGGTSITYAATFNRVGRT
jgi:hypothetical protein